MTEKWFGARLAMLGAALVIGAPLSIQTAEAARTRSGQQASHGSAYTHANARAMQAGMMSARSGSARWGRSVARYSRGSGGLQCVPFARENSGIELSGNANTWWDNAEGVYERGARPEVGSVLNFRATGRMHMGHVAVVANVIDARNIQIDQANWSSRGSVSRNITVVDVSERNDWSAVRVALSNGGDYGSIYPTYGFIYDRPDRGTMVANAGSAPAPLLNAAPRDLRPAAERNLAILATDVEEVAEAGDEVAPRGRRHASRHSRFTGRASVVRVHTRTAPAPAAAHHGRRHRL